MSVAHMKAISCVLSYTPLLPPPRPTPTHLTTHLPLTLGCLFAALEPQPARLFSRRRNVPVTIFVCDIIFIRTYKARSMTFNPTDKDVFAVCSSDLSLDLWRYTRHPNHELEKLGELDQATPNPAVRIVYSV